MPLPVIPRGGIFVSGCHSGGVVSGLHVCWPGIRQFGAAGWSSPVARQAHNLKVVGSNPTPATIAIVQTGPLFEVAGFFVCDVGHPKDGVIVRPSREMYRLCA